MGMQVDECKSPQVTVIKNNFELKLLQSKVTFKVYIIQLPYTSKEYGKKKGEEKVKRK